MIITFYYESVVFARDFVRTPYRSLLLDVIYNFHQNKVTFNLSNFPGATGSLTLTYGLDDFVKWPKEIPPGALPILKMTRVTDPDPGLPEKIDEEKGTFIR